MFWRRAAAGALVAMLAPRPAGAVPQPAASADTFVDSICVCTHWSYPDTPYGMAYEQVKQRLVDSGIRHIRDGLHPRLRDLARHGIRATVPVDPDPNGGGAEVTRDAIKAFNAMPPAAVEAVEGPNEPDLFWPRYHPNGYKGQKFPAGAVAFMKDLFTAFKADPMTREITVVGIALGSTLTYGNPDNPLGNAGELAAFVDWGNFHPYPGGNAFNVPFRYAGIEKYYWDGNFPSIALDEYPMAMELYSKPYAPKPMMATETGYSTYTDGVTRKVAGKYVPRLYLEYFRLGIKRACVYEFVDEWNRPPDREANFGMLANDLSPKPSYNAVRSLIALLADPGPAFTPEALDYDLVVRPVSGYDRIKYVHHLLLQKRDGTFYLVLWHEISNMDGSTKPPRELSHPDMPATVTLRQAPTLAVGYRFDEQGHAEPQMLAPGMTFTLDVPDRPLVLALSFQTAPTPLPLDAAPPAPMRDAAIADGAIRDAPLPARDAALPEARRASDAATGGARDASRDAAVDDAEPSPNAGCGCRVGSSMPGTTLALVPFLAVAVAGGGLRRWRRRG